MEIDAVAEKRGMSHLSRRAILRIAASTLSVLTVGIAGCGQPSARPNQQGAGGVAGAPPSGTTPAPGPTTGSIPTPVAAQPTTGVATAISAQPAVAVAGKTAEIIFWPRNPGESSVVWEKIVPLAKKMYPEVTVKLQPPAEDFNNKLLVAYAGGTPPDSGVTGLSTFRAFIGKKVFKSLQDHIDADADVKGWLKDYVPAAIQGYGYQGKLYAAPTVNESIVLFYNADAIREAGLTPPREIESDPQKWNWDTLVTYAKAINKGTGSRRARYGIIATGNKSSDGVFGISETWGNLAYARGGHFLDDDGEKCIFNTPETVEAVQWVTDLTFKHDVQPNVADSASAGVLDRAYFQSGQIGMVIQGEYFRRYLWGSGKPSAGIPFNYDLAMMPFCPATGKRTNIYHGNGSFMVSQTKNPTATWEWLKTIFSKEAQEIITANWGSRGANLTTYDGWLKSNAGGGPPGLNYEAIIKADKDTAPFPTTPYLTPDAMLEPTVRIMYDNVFQNKQPVQAGLDQLVRETNALLEKGKKELDARK